MKIQDVTLDIEQSLANLAVATLPPPLRGLRHLPLGDYEPRVSFRYWNGKQQRKIRRDADASYFNPETCELVIEFVPSGNPDDGKGGREADRALAAGDDAGDTADGGGTAALDGETAMDQLLDSLAEIERTRDFVSLKWFRDQCLPTRGLDWAGDPRKSGSLLRRATEQRLILTSQVPNPNNPLHPVTAIRINRRHPRFETERPARRDGFERVRIRGGAIADTVLGDRR